MKTLEQIRNEYETQFEIAYKAFFEMMKTNRLFTENPTCETESAAIKAKEMYITEGNKVTQIKSEIEKTYNASVKA